MASHTDRIILSYGMGVDSTAILLRWLTDPTSRDFELSQLTVLTAQVGNEYPETYRLVRDHVLPQLHAAGVRFVQVARGGYSEADGVVVLGDSANPTELVERGPVAYSDELVGAATIQTCSNRRCTLKWKGWVLDRWIEPEVGEAPYHHCIGFAVGEERRVAKDQNFGGVGARVASYPLIEWGWDRATCEAFIESVVGEPWRKSCCVYCPFQQRRDAVERWDDEPEAAGQALEIEDIALRFNPNMKLFKTAAARELVEQAGNQAALDAFEQRLDQRSWSVYLVRRAYGAGKLHVAGCSKRGCQCSTDPSVKGAGANCKRDIRELTAGSRAACLAELMKVAAEYEVTVEAGCRAELKTKREEYPTREAIVVVAPRVVRPKGEKHTKAFEKLYASCKAADEAAKTERKAA